MGEVDWGSKEGMFFLQVFKVTLGIEPFFCVRYPLMLGEGIRTQSSTSDNKNVHGKTGGNVNGDKVKGILRN